MPTYRDLTVQVTDANDIPLTEYGVRKLDRAKLSTCYIQSETNKAFRIKIVPGDTYFDYSSDSSSENGEDEGILHSRIPKYKLKMHFTELCRRDQRDRRIRTLYPIQIPSVQVLVPRVQGHAV